MSDAWTQYQASWHRQTAGLRQEVNNGFAHGKPIAYVWTGTAYDGVYTPVDAPRPVPAGFVCDTRTNQAMEHNAIIRMFFARVSRQHQQHPLPPATEPVPFVPNSGPRASSSGYARKVVHYDEATGFIIWSET